MEPPALPLVDPLDSELARLEGAVAGGHDQRARADRWPPWVVSVEDLVVPIARALEVAYLLAEVDLGPELEALLDAEVDERLALDLRMPGDVEDVLLGVDGGDLAAELLEGLDDADGRLAMARVVRRRQPDGPPPMIVMS